MSLIKKCPHCYETGENIQRYKFFDLDDDNLEFQKGFIELEDEKINKCPYCNTQLLDIGISLDDFYFIKKFSKNNRRLLEALIELSKKDIIEYETRMNQLRIQSKQLDATNQQQNQQKQVKESEENKVKCPRCGSTNIVTGQRGFSILTGFIGSSKTMNRCASCGYKWSPKK